MCTPKGFTLIELLVVIAVLAVVGSIIGTALTTSLRGSNKATVTTAVQQNGSYAISQITKTIRNALVWNAASGDGMCCDATGSTVIDCSQTVVPTPNPTPAPVHYSSIAITSSVNNTQTTFSCDFAAFRITSKTGTQASQSLLDTNNVKVVDANSCYFTCIKYTSTDEPIIGIYFVLQQAGTSSLFEQVVLPITFQTSVVMRNNTH